MQHCQMEPPERLRTMLTRTSRDLRVFSVWDDAGTRTSFLRVVRPGGAGQPDPAAQSTVPPGVPRNMAQQTACTCT